MIPTISQVCCLNSTFAEDVEEFESGHCNSLEVWMTKLEHHLQSHSIDDVKRLLEKFRMQAPVASFQGGLLASQGEARRAAWELFVSRLQLCKELSIATLVVACDVPGPLDEITIQRVQQSLVQAAEAAEQHSVRLALEFQADSAIGNNLLTASALVSEVGSPHLGICLDAFHFYVGPSQTEDLGCLTRDNLFHVQLCDVADKPREFALDADRILPGEGDIPLTPIVQYLRQIDFQGCVSLELLNPQLWQIPATQIGEIGMTSLRKLLGQAAMDG